MSCREMKDWIHGYIDGELDLSKSVEMEQHLRSCPACQMSYAGFRRLSSTLKDESFYHPAPTNLRKMVEARLRGVPAGTAKAPVNFWRWMPAFSALALVAAAVVLFVNVRTHPAEEELLMAEIVSAHVRSLMPGHLTDVESSDQHTVKPWFNGRLDFSPQVRDLAASGFPLDGGRLDYIKSRPVASLVFHRQKHFINLFIWPQSQGSGMRPVQVSKQGYNLLHWSAAGMSFWAVSDLNMAELRQFARLQQAPG